MHNDEAIKWLKHYLNYEDPEAALNKAMRVIMEITEDKEVVEAFNAVRVRWLKSMQN